MEGVQDSATDVKGKGKAPEADTMEESMDDDSSDESGAEDQVCTLLCHRHAMQRKPLILNTLGWRR